jgi:hypothetical protein
VSDLTTQAAMTHEEALRLADALIGQAVKETEARCRMLAQFIDDCDRAGSHSAGWSEALRELRALQDRRGGFNIRRRLIQQALDCPVGDSPAATPLSPPQNRAAPVVRRQVQVQAHRRRS